ncbi:ORM1 2 [Solea senegalensis]|uniref:ORM1 2 n=1 Tax=Solea senegalensis TaxID=28829 RepID=A0AAV6SV54_SOLSE|nr:ORM1 2 [Solea senegalensis]
MTFSFATSAALFLFFAAASCAPVHHSCADVRNSSLVLLRTVKSITAEIGPKEESNISSSLLWMEAKDGCDPSSLREKPAQCIEKILRVLVSYSVEMKELAGFQNCSEFAHKLKPVMEGLIKKMTTCLKSRTGMELHIKEEKPKPNDLWEKLVLCPYTMNRLFSFSVLTARVFAVGDPTRHGSTQNPPCSSG